MNLPVQDNKLSTIFKYSIKHSKTSRVLPQTAKNKSNNEDLHMAQRNTQADLVNRLNLQQEGINGKSHTLTHTLKYHQHHKTG